jgi:hypothetical protein
MGGDWGRWVAQIQMTAGVEVPPNLTPPAQLRSRDNKPAHLTGRDHEIPVARPRNAAPAPQAVSGWHTIFVNATPHRPGPFAPCRPVDAQGI